MDKQIYIYINIKGRIIEAIPDDFREITDHWHPTYVEKCVAYFDKQVNCEEKHGDYYRRTLAAEPGEIRGNAIWLTEKNLDKARKIFLEDVTKKYNKISKQFNAILDEKERLEAEL